MARTQFTNITKSLNFDETSFQTASSLQEVHRHWNLLDDVHRVKTVFAMFFAAAIALYICRTLFDILGIEILDLFWPFVCGAAVTLFTWVMTYLDSVQPGVNPPMPLSPLKIRENSEGSMHISYVMAIANGVLVFVLATWYREKEQ